MFKRAEYYLTMARISTSAIVLVTGLATAAQAQINPFRGNTGPVLPKADNDAAIAAAGRLLGDHPAAVGKVEQWSGATSGNRGSMTVERAFKRAGNDCRTVRSRVQFKGGTSNSYVLDVCRIDGQWKMM